MAMAHLANVDLFAWCPTAPIPQRERKLTRGQSAHARSSSTSLFGTDEIEDPELVAERAATAKLDAARRRRALRGSASESAMTNKERAEKDEVERLLAKLGRFQEAAIRSQSHRRVRKVRPSPILR